jgi:hypothetical protein
LASPDDRAALLDSGPSSDVRPIDRRARRLALDTGLRGEGAQASWLTVTSCDGFLFFEGPVSECGCLEISFEGAPDVDRVRVLLETPRSHRLAEIALLDGWTVHTFA